MPNCILGHPCQLINEQPTGSCSATTSSPVEQNVAFSAARQPDHPSFKEKKFDSLPEEEKEKVEALVYILNRSRDPSFQWNIIVQ